MIQVLFCTKELSSLTTKNGPLTKIVLFILCWRKLFFCIINETYKCFTAGIGTLNVYLMYGSTNRSIFTASGNKGQGWFKGQATISANSAYNIVFEGVRGRDYHGDIALDDISLLDGTCNLQTTPSSVSTPPTPGPSAGDYYTLFSIAIK